MRHLRTGLLGALMLVVLDGRAAVLTVTTAHDEANCRSVAGCSTPPNGSGENYPNSTGCSLREALQDIADAAAAYPNPPTLSYPECGTPDAGPAATNTIVLGAQNIQINAAEPDPTDVTGTNLVHNGLLPFVGDKATWGTLSITGGTLSCFSDASAMPPIAGVSILTEAAGASLSIAGTHFQNCTAPADGAAIVNSGTGDLTLTGVTFTNIRATNQGNGGCVRHGSGTLAITGASFTTCVVDDGGALPGGGHGNGGALYIGNVGGQQKVAISGVTFQGNLAGDNGGAIYLAGTDAIAIDTSNFSGNIANGNTNSEGNAELGGGAIYATGTALQGHDGSGGLNASAFLIFQSAFVGNLAPQGTGGAILLTSGNLTYGNLAFNLGEYQLGKVDGIPGGIVASNFSGNVAGGTSADVPIDPRAGSGGALYANAGNVSVFASSFVGGNSSQNASGGAIAYNDAGDSFAPLAISNTTFNGNSAAAKGGAIANLVSKFTGNAGKVTLTNDTISGNSAGAGGGGAFFNGNASAAEVVVANTIFDGGGAGGNCAGNPFTDPVAAKSNLEFNPTGTCAGVPAGDPKLKSPALFGGVNALVFTMDLNSGSAASGAGDPATCANSPILNLDEALNGRPKGKPNCDIGAFESAIVPDLTIAKSHTDPFVQGAAGDTYTITVGNAGNDATTGTVTVDDTLPAGLTATAIAGSGWSCAAPPTLHCTRNDALGSGANYPAITLTVDVAANASGPLTNTATVAGGSEANTANDTANDSTNIVGVPDLTVTKSHLDPFSHNQIGATYTISVSNVGNGPTMGTVTVTDTLPAGLTATAIGGSGWSNCTATPVVGPGTLSCTRSDVLANGASYPNLIVTVDVAANAPNPVTNSVTVSGGGETNLANDTFNDQTTTPVRLQDFHVD
jgi:predicted outer membrane repeat protein